MTDIPWPKAYIDARVRPAMDMQYAYRDEALAGTGIELRKPERAKKERMRCYRCSAFIHAVDYYAGQCKRCGWL